MIILVSGRQSHVTLMYLYTFIDSGLETHLGRTVLEYGKHCQGPFIVWEWESTINLVHWILLWTGNNLLFVITLAIYMSNIECSFCILMCAVQCLFLMQIHLCLGKIITELIISTIIVTVAGRLLKVNILTSWCSKSVPTSGGGFAMSLWHPAHVLSVLQLAVESSFGNSNLDSNCVYFNVTACSSWLSNFVSWIRGGYTSIREEEKVLAWLSFT